MLSGRGLCDEPITRSKESYRLWRVVVCHLETSKEEAKSPLRAVNTNPQCVVTPRGKKKIGVENIITIGNRHVIFFVATVRNLTRYFI